MELLIVVVVIAILASITIVSYNGIQASAKKSQLLSNMSTLHKRLEIYRSENGEYPKTQNHTVMPGTDGVLLADKNCTSPTGPYTTYTESWIPGLNNLPQSSSERGARGTPGCYIYQSDGDRFILSAWNMVSDGSAESSNMYRRLGFRESNFNPYYLCNHDGVIGGINADRTYSASLDRYKHSYTISSINSCDETPRV